MKKFLAYIAAAVLALCLLSSCKEGKVIPRGTMSKIYAEMFLADQWLRDHPAARPVADTTLFYEPIFNKYGYRKIDYITSVDTYISDPEKFSKILKGSISILEEQEKQAVRLSEFESKLNALTANLRNYSRKDFSPASWYADTLGLWGRSEILRLDEMDIAVAADTSDVAADSLSLAAEVTDVQIDSTDTER